MSKEPIQNKDELMRVLLSQRETIRSFGVKELHVFGSFVRNEHINKQSDIDFLVEFEEGKKSFDNFIDLNFFLEDLTGRKVELLTYQSLSQFIGPHIIKHMEHVGI
jgi:predicted nucleotidyltransferase